MNRKPAMWNQPSLQEIKWRGQKFLDMIQNKYYTENSLDQLNLVVFILMKTTKCDLRFR